MYTHAQKTKTTHTHTHTRTHAQRHTHARTHAETHMTAHMHTRTCTHTFTLTWGGAEVKVFTTSSQNNKMYGQHATGTQHGG